MISPFVTENDNKILGIDNNIIIIGLLILSIIYLISLNNESFIIAKNKEKFTTYNVSNQSTNIFDNLKNKAIDTHTTIRDFVTDVVTQGNTEPLTGQKVLENVTTVVKDAQKNLVNKTADTLTGMANMITSYF